VHVQIKVSFCQSACKCHFLTLWCRLKWPSHRNWKFKFCRIHFQHVITLCLWDYIRTYKLYSLLNYSNTQRIKRVCTNINSSSLVKIYYAYFVFSAQVKRIESSHFRRMKAIFAFLQSSLKQLCGMNGGSLSKERIYSMSLSSRVARCLMRKITQNVAQPIHVFCRISIYITFSVKSS
jgi:hypothetical protein